MSFYDNFLLDIYFCPQCGKLYDDIVVKLPVLILYGSEEYWEVEEKERMVGDQDAFGFRKEEEDANEDEDVTIENLDINDTEESDGKAKKMSNKK